MNILTDNVVFPGWLVSQPRPNEWAATWILKGTFRLTPGGPALPPAEGEEPESVGGDLYLDDDDTKSLSYFSDFVPFKPQADILLVGAAHAPGARPVSHLRTTLHAGPISKALVVFGDRQWNSSMSGGAYASPPQPFVTMPLCYESAYGGPGYKPNPVGRGWKSEGAPNIEYPENLATGPRSRVTPAGFGPLAAAWEPRCKNLGTYDKTWQKERWPFLPHDFDWSHFNAAPLDQRVDGFLRGDEALGFENLHPDHPLYRSGLPGLRARCVVGERAADGTLLQREIELKLDTLWVDMEAEKLVLVWRGMAPVRSLKLEHVEELLAFTEPLTDPPAPVDEARARLLPQEDEDDDDFGPSDEELAANQAAFDKEFEDMNADFARVEAEAKAAEVAHIARLVAAGIDPKQIEQAVQTAPCTLPEIRKSVEAAIAKLEPTHPEEAARLREIPLDEMEQMDEEMTAIEQDGEPPLTRESVAAAVAAGQSLRERDMSELDLSGLDLSGANFEEASLKKTDLTGARLSGVNLTDANLSGAILTDADLRGATLDEADLTGAQLTGARLQGVSLEDATLAKLDLQGADFSNGKGLGADFTGANLTGARFEKADFPQACFSETVLDHAVFAGGSFKAAQFEGVHAHGIVMTEADISGIHADGKADFTGGRFESVQGEGSIWEDAILDGADFSRAHLARAIFVNASLRGAMLDRADLSGAMLDDAVLHAARLTNANLLRVTFDRADLTDADLSGSNMYEAGFWDAKLERTSLAGANLKGTTLK